MRHAPLLILLLSAACSKSDKTEPAPAPALTPGVVRGTIDIKPELAAQVAPGDSVFIAARKGGGGGGPPLAVARLPMAAFPIAFELTKDNVMVAGAGELEGVVELTVRIDKDGDAMTRTAGDLFAKLPGVQVGDTAVKVVIDQVQP